MDEVVRRPIPFTTTSSTHKRQDAHGNYSCNSGHSPPYLAHQDQPDTSSAFLIHAGLPNRPSRFRYCSICRSAAAASSLCSPHKAYINVRGLNQRFWWHCCELRYSLKNTQDHPNSEPKCTLRHFEGYSETKISFMVFLIYQSVASMDLLEAHGSNTLVN